MTKRIAFAVVVVIAALLGASSVVLAQGAAAPKQAADDPGWDVSVYPVLAYLPVMGINVRLPDAPPCIGCPPDTPPESRANSGLSGAAFVGFRVEKSRFGYGFSKEKLNGTLQTAKFGNKDIHLDYTLHGPILGIGIHF